MKILFYNTKDFEREYLIAANEDLHEINFSQELLSESTAYLAIGFDVISIFSGDGASVPLIKKLNHAGVRGIAIRGVDYHNVDIIKSNELGIRVANVPQDSASPPYDELLKELMGLSGAKITPHHAFATRVALKNIAAATFYNINCWAENKYSENELPHAEKKPVKNNNKKANYLKDAGIVSL